MDVTVTNHFIPPESLNLGAVHVHLYSIFILVGIFAGYYLAKGPAARKGISPELLQTSIFYGFIAGLIGARAYHVIDQWSVYSGDFASIFAIWNGGLGILGGLAGGLVGLWFFAKRYKIRLLDILDTWAPSVLLAQAIGRFGNWTNQEAFGHPTDGPLKIYIDPAHRPDQYIASSYFHPTFFYEAGWDLLGVLVLVLARKRLADKPGAMFGLYLVWYSIGRFAVEFFRFDTAKLFGLATAHIVAVFLLLLGLYLIGESRLVKPTAKPATKAAKPKPRKR